jgi:hypothetical protein
VIGFDGAKTTTRSDPFNIVFIDGDRISRICRDRHTICRDRHTICRDRHTICRDRQQITNKAAYLSSLC